MCLITLRQKQRADAPCDFKLVSPVNGATDVDARTVLDNGSRQTMHFSMNFKVYPENDADNPVISREYMIYNRYTTAAAGALEPGKTYCWEVTATIQRIRRNLLNVRQEAG